MVSLGGSRNWGVRCECRRLRWDRQGYGRGTTLRIGLACGCDEVVAATCSSRLCKKGARLPCACQKRIKGRLRALHHRPSRQQWHCRQRGRDAPIACFDVIIQAFCAWCASGDCGGWEGGLTVRMSQQVPWTLISSHIPHSPPRHYVLLPLPLRHAPLPPTRRHTTHTLCLTLPLHRRP